MTLTSCIITDCNDQRWSTLMLCSLHSGRALAALRSISSNAAEIRASAGRSTAPQAQRVAGSRDPVLPAAALLTLDGPWAEGGYGPTFGDHAEDLSDDPPITFLLDQIARQVAEGRCDLPAPTLDDLVAFLARHHSWTCSQNWADTYYEDVTEIAAKVRARAGNGPARQTSRLPCAACGMRATLVQPDSAEAWECRTILGGCGTKESDHGHDLRVDALEAAKIEREADEETSEGERMSA